VLITIYFEYFSAFFYTQEKGKQIEFLPVCVLMCRFKSVERANAREHCEHWYGFSPVWLRMCRCKSVDRTNARSHLSHLYGDSPRK